MAETIGPAAAGGDLLFVGDIYCDLVMAGVSAPEIGAEVFASGFAISPGGVANRAVAAARAGAPTRLLSRLGEDPLGREMRVMLAAEPGLDTSWITCVPDRQTPITVSLTSPENRSFVTYDEDLGPLDLPAGAGPVGAVHVGIATELPAWVATLRAAGTRVVGGVGWDSAGVWSRDVLDRLAEIDVFVPNDIEAMRYTRTDSALEAAKALAERVPLAVVTRGGDGVVAIDSATGVVTEISAVPVDVIDPTGAGDIFVASFMAAERYPDWDLTNRLRFAALSASLSVRRLGGAVSAPRPADLRRFVDQARPAGNWSFLGSHSTTPTQNGES
ncbi:carbohydrate kinase family protein [Microlunatus ginsengisoli]|uniref:PfkB family carbohydrate kinase n=1 Tax=Microlunatus ginsengisoli TaxID=363863 RepID=A0ABP7AAY3_9ACTN